jgi:hypothetical protein
MNTKTTLELPDDLLQQIKLRALLERRKLKDTVTELLRFAIAHAPQPAHFIPKPSRLRGGFKPGFDDIEAAIAFGRDD